MDKPLRILAIVNLPWDRRLGAARVWRELSDQWEKAGHKIDKYCLDDAFPNPTTSRALYAWRQAVFSYRAASFVRRNADKFDIIDCLIGTLPFSKQSLRFNGLLVDRSIGLYLDYDKFIRASRERWPDQPRGKLAGRILYGFTAWLLRRNADRALGYCDLFNVPNEEEKRSLEAMAVRAPAIVLPYGLNDHEREVFANTSRPASERLARKEVCFVGMWGLRKGSRDWPEIVRAILKTVPDARFSFLGTMTDEQTVLRDLGLSPRESIRCFTNYDPKDLPQLIAGCAVGLFPSYIEGFGISVIEQLASGIPTIAYDVPGPRHIFKGAGAQLLVPAGDVKAMSNRALEILRLNESDYRALSIKCREIAAKFRWEQIAEDNIRGYRFALKTLRMDTILQIVPKIPGDLDGVGDYALGIARVLREKFHCDTVFAAFNAKAGEAGGFKLVPLDSLPEDAPKYDRVLLHYVNYGFQKRGVPFRLLSILRSMRESHRAKFVTVFHELYASGLPWTSAFWLQPFQIDLAKSIARLSDACIVSSDYSRRELRRLSPHAEIELHPVPSGLGEPLLSADQIRNRDPHRWAIFGGAALAERSLRSFRQLMSRIPNSIAPRSLFVLGGAENPVTRSLLADLGIESNYRPRIAAAGASDLLKTCSFAFLNYFHRPNVETAIILKSSAFASACAHAVIPVLPHGGSTIAIDGERLPGPFFVDFDRAEIPTGDARPKMATGIYDWYQRHAASEHLVRSIAEKLTLNAKDGKDG